MNALLPLRGPLRVALFSGNYQYVRDGSNQALNRWVDFLERHGAAVRVYSPTGDTAAFPHAGTLVSVPSIAIPRRREYRFALGLPRAIERDVAAFRPNVFHLSAPDLLGYRALGLALKWGVPAIASVHTRFETYFRYYGLNWVEKFVVRYLRHFYSQCTEIYAPTVSMAQTLRAQGMSERVALWGRGVDRAVFSPARRSAAWRSAKGFAPSDVIVLFVGRLVREKGLETFANTIDSLRAKGVSCRVLVVGEGPERDWFQKRLPQAVFAGFLQGEELACAYASSDIFFNPSITETFGNVTLEAMASGLPSVCASATGSVSLVRDGVTGLLSPNCSVEEFTVHLDTLIRSNSRRRAMAAAALQTSRGYVWEDILGDLFHRVQAVVSQAPVFDPCQVRELELSEV